MKTKFFLISLVVILGLFSTGCQKDYINPEPGLVRTDTPPSGLFNSEYDYGAFYKVYVEKGDIDNAEYMGSYNNGSYSQYYDPNTGVQVRQYVVQDYYKISAKKYFGFYMSKTYVSESVDFYLISVGDLAYAKKRISQKGSVVVSINNGQQLDSRWRTITGIE